MKKAFFTLLILALVIGMAIPMAVPASAAGPTTVTYQSDTSTQFWAGASSSDINGSGYIVPPAGANFQDASLYSAGSFPTYWNNTMPDSPGKATLFSSPAASWIWRDSVVTTGQSYTGDIVFFKKNFDIPAGAVNIQATLYITADNAYYFYVNNPSWSGTPAGSLGFFSGYSPTNFYYTANGTNISGGDNSTSYETVGNLYPLDACCGRVGATGAVSYSWETVNGYDISSDITTGNNELEMVGINEHAPTGGVSANPAGIIYKLVVSYDIVPEFITGGGTVNTSTGTKGWNIAGNAGFLPDGTLVGNFNIIDFTNGDHYVCHNAFSSLTFEGDQTYSPTASYNEAILKGTFTDKSGSELPLTLTITDNNDGGGGYDTVAIAGLTGYPSGLPGPTINNGNFQIHSGYK